MKIPEDVLLDKVTLRTCCIPYERKLYVLRVSYESLSVPIRSIFFSLELGPGTIIFGDPIPLNFST